MKLTDLTYIKDQLVNASEFMTEAEMIEHLWKNLVFEHNEHFKAIEEIVTNWENNKNGLRLRYSALGSAREAIQLEKDLDNFILDTFKAHNHNRQNN